MAFGDDLVEVGGLGGGEGLEGKVVDDEQLDGGQAVLDGAQDCDDRGFCGTGDADGRVAGGRLAVFSWAAAPCR